MTKNAERASDGGSSPWAVAKTFGELCYLMGRFCEGKLPDCPGHLGPLNDESDPIRQFLVAINKSGFLTTDSQPGMPWDKTKQSGQRAYLTGFAQSSVVEKLDDCLLSTDLYMAVYWPHQPCYRVGFEPNRIVVTPGIADEGRPDTHLGNDGTSTWKSFVDACDDRIVDELDNAAYIVIVDFCWGQRDRLFREVLRALSPSDT